MRLLAQPKVLGRSFITALATSLACVPKLASWTERGAPVLFLWLVLLWAMFILWSFVFAWQGEYAKRPAFSLEFRPGLWAMATLYALASALAVHFFVDPQIRVVAPRDYPANWNSLLPTAMFSVAFDPLFFCFAPFAFFIRLFRKQDAALVLTVVFGLFVLALKLNAGKGLPPLWVVVELMALRILAGFVSLFFYLKGGVLLVWWLVLVLQLRFVLDVALKN
jgi:hypothetical protein